MLNGPAANPAAKTDAVAAPEATGLLDAHPAVVTGGAELVVPELDVAVVDVDVPSAVLLVVLGETAAVVPPVPVALDPSDDDPLVQPPATTMHKVRAITADRRRNRWSSIDPRRFMASPR